MLAVPNFLLVRITDLLGLNYIIGRDDRIDCQNRVRRILVNPSTGFKVLPEVLIKPSVHSSKIQNEFP